MRKLEQPAAQPGVLHFIPHAAIVRIQLGPGARQRRFRRVIRHLRRHRCVVGEGERWVVQGRVGAGRAYGRSSNVGAWLAIPLIRSGPQVAVQRRLGVGHDGSAGVPAGS